MFSSLCFSLEMLKAHTEANAMIEQMWIMYRNF